MKLSSIFSVLGAFGVIFYTNHSEGDPFAALINTEAAVIVVGGALAAALGQFHLSGVIHGLKGLKMLIKPPKFEPGSLIDDLVDWSRSVRKNGLLSLEDELEGIKDPFLRDGLQMVIDGLEVNTVRSLLQTRIETDEIENSEPAEVWDAIGGYAPTLGVLGAVMGLIHVMLHLHGSGNAIGNGIAAAFVATLYGVGAANLIFIPAGKRLERLVEEQVRYREMVVTGIVLLAEGTNSQTIRTQLGGYIGARAGNKATRMDGEVEADDGATSQG